MDSKELEKNKKKINPKFEPLPGEFVYKNVYWVMWSSLKIIQKLENDFIFYPNDVLIATYPKSGTTVLQEIAWLILNNVDIDQAKRRFLVNRCPFLDENAERNYEEYNYKGKIVDGAQNIPRPRFMKTHLTYRNLESQMKKNPEMKVLVTIRNPRDNAVSMFHFYKGVTDYGPFEGSWNDYFERWIDGWISGGDWLDVTTEWWNKRFDKNIKIIFFEDIVYKKRDVILDVCKFLNKNLTESQIDQIISHTDFKEMKDNAVINFSLMEDAKIWGGKNFQFMRKGEVGDWKNYFTEEQIKRLDDKYNSILEKCGLKFQYE